MHAARVGMSLSSLLCVCDMDLFIHSHEYRVA